MPRHTTFGAPSRRRPAAVLGRAFTMAALLLGLLLESPLEGAAVATPSPPSASPPDGAAAVDDAMIEGWIEQLDAADLETRRAAASALIEVGEPALPAVEAAFARGRHHATGQPKIVLMALRAARASRLWTARLSALADEGFSGVYLRRRAGRPDGRLRLRVSSVEEERGVVRVVIHDQPAGRDPERTIEAMLTLDRTLAPRWVTVEVDGAPTAGGEIRLADRRMTGSFGGRAIDARAPRPASLDLALGLAVACMPLEPDATLVTRVISAADGTVGPVSTIRCTGRTMLRDRRGDQPAWAFEMTVGTTGGPPGEEPAARFVVDADGVLRRAVLGTAFELELLEREPPPDAARDQG